MGLLTGKDDDLNASLELEKMMKQFDIDIDDETDYEEERIKRRRNKIKKERE